MVSVKIIPGKIQGEIQIPSSKSHTIRSLLFSLMAKGKSRIQRALPSPDTLAMIDAIRHLGARIDVEDDSFIIEGVAGKLHPAEDIIQCGNSGQVLRFIGALSALSNTYTVLTGDLSIRHLRSVLPLIDGLTQLGAFASSTRLDGFAPLIIKGPIKHEKAKIQGEDSQPISGLLILGAFTPLELEVIRPGEKPWIELTLSWFDRFGISYENQNFERYKLKGGAKIEAFEYRVPGDFSSAAFPLCASLITHSSITLDNMDLSDSQGDQAIIPALESMGAKFEMEGMKIKIQKGSSLRGQKLDINPYIDALPILAVIGCFSSGQTEIVNAEIARRKECDRIHCISKELKKMGAEIEEKIDGLNICSSKLKGAMNLESHHDHRIAMALTVAALGAEGESVIRGVECIAKSYPSFYEDLRKLGVKLEFK